MNRARPAQGPVRPCVRRARASGYGNSSGQRRDRPIGGAGVRIERSPRRQRADAKPNQVMNPNNRMKITSATQFTSTVHSPDGSARPFGRNINDGRHDRAHQNERHLKPGCRPRTAPGSCRRVTHSAGMNWMSSSRYHQLHFVSRAFIGGIPRLDKADTVI
jgi:hypothetical protein